MGLSSLFTILLKLGARAAVAVASVGALLVWALRRYVFTKQSDDADVTIGFFHPYCNAGGGGERVLWCAIQALAAATEDRKLKVVVFTGDKGVSGEAILQRAQDRFNISIPQSLNVQFVYINTRKYLEADMYPRFTLAGQALGSMLVAAECLSKLVPDVWCDTTGAAFTFPVARLAGCSVACYVHYPMVSTDMLARVQERRPDYNNNSAIASSTALTVSKLVYYRLFAFLYGAVGRLAHLVIVNSSWTQGHIDHLWGTASGNSASTSTRGLPAGALDAGIGAATDGGSGVRRRRAGSEGAGQPFSSASAPADTHAASSSSPQHHDDDAGLASHILSLFCNRAASASNSDTAAVSHVVYPPCNTEQFRLLPLEGPSPGGRQRTIVSIAQFRPEKDHALQLRSFALFKQRNPSLFADVKLVMIGGVRDKGDADRVDGLKRLADTLGIGSDVEFNINAPFPELKAACASARASLHSMWNEHFGISVVESMAAGVVTIAHNSGGPQCDIVVPWGNRNNAQRTGYLAAKPDEYADVLELIFTNDAIDRGMDVSSNSNAAAVALPSADAPAVPTAAAKAAGDAASNEEDAARAAATAVVDEIVRRVTDPDGTADDAKPDAAATPVAGTQKQQQSQKASPARPAAPSKDIPRVDLLAITRAARESTERFSDAEFCTAWYAHIIGLVRKVEREKKGAKRQRGAAAIAS